MASKRAQRRKACRGKVQHADKESAVVAARNTRIPGSLLCVYRCRWCGFFHVGHAPKHVKEAMERRRLT